MLKAISPARSFAALLCATMLAAPAAHAADLLTTPGTTFDCGATLSGVIAAGDLDQIRRINSQRRFSGDRPLCLNSEGGSFDEAIRIADYLYDQGISTAIDEGARCLGSCAFAFLGGSNRDGGAPPLPAKTLHLNAELGFSTPRLSAEGETTQDIVAVAMKAAGQILSRADKFDMSPDFAAKVLSVPASDVLYVRRIDEARALGLTLQGYQPPSSLTDEMVTRACILEDAEFDPGNTSAEKAVYDNRVLRESGAMAHRKATYLVEAIIDGVPSWRACLVELNNAGRSAIDPTPFIRFRTSPEWTEGGNPPLRQVQTALVSESWKEIAYQDIWKLFPASQTLADSVKQPSPEATDAILVAAVGELPPTTRGTEEKLDLRFDDRQEIQNRLTLLGFDTRGADGIFGPGSRAALQEWQESIGTQPTGFLDAAQRDQLFRQSEALYQDFLAEQAREEAERERLANQAPAFTPRPRRTAPAPAPAPEPQRQRVRVCQRGLFGELVNCRIEFR
ncbi:peptidoglycan-binding protein [Antarctobacter jejuensis]|uniref:peptidoglycan-binding protein n=1 Tax=Antarctobacter jejuensis TaxID=1439938 RepID=UPI003FCF2D85